MKPTLLNQPQILADPLEIEVRIDLEESARIEPILQSPSVHREDLHHEELFRLRDKNVADAFDGNRRRASHDLALDAGARCQKVNGDSRGRAKSNGRDPVSVVVLD
jgi:hypothetical protein